jgi:hypothetical protein
MSATVVEGDREDGTVARPGLAYVEGPRFSLRISNGLQGGLSDGVCNRA